MKFAVASSLTNGYFSDRFNVINKLHDDFGNSYLPRLAKNNCWIKSKINCQLKSMKKKDNFGGYPKNHIKQLRAAAGLALRDLADKANMSHQTLSNLELSKAELTVAKAKTIADALGCHYLDLIEGPAAATAAKDVAEKELLDAFRGLDDNAKQIYLHTLKSFEAAQKAMPELPVSNPTKRGNIK